MPRQSSVQSILCCIVRCNLDDFRYFGISLLSSIKMGSCTKGSTLQVIAGICRYTQVYFLQFVSDIRLCVAKPC